MPHNDTFICPSPLVVADSWEYYSLVVVGDCVVPCPSMEQSESDWKKFALTLQILAALSLFFSLLCFGCHAIEYKKYFMRLNAIGGCVILSIIFCIFFAINNPNNGLICHTTAHYVEQGDFCVVQAGSMVFFGMWIEIWAVILSFDTYLHVNPSYRVGNLVQLQRKYFLFAFAFSATIVLIIYLGDNLGFDPTTNLPICSFLFYKNENYFWYAFFTPFCSLCAIGIGFTIAGGYRMQQVFVLGIKDRDRVMSVNDGTKKVELNAVRKSLSEDVCDSSEYMVDYSGRHTGNEGASSDGGLSRASSEFWRPSFTVNSMWDTESCDEDFGHTAGGTIGHRSDPMGLHVHTDQQEDHPHARELASETGGGETTSKPVSVDEDMQSRSRSIQFLQDTWKYNGRSVLFVITFCITILIVAPILYVLYHDDYNTYVRAAEQFSACLVASSIACPVQTQDGVDTCGREECGEYPNPRPNLALEYTVLCWFCGFGIIPALVFGFNSYAKKCFKSA